MANRYVFLFVLMFLDTVAVYAQNSRFRLVSSFEQKQGWFLASDVGAFAALGGFRDPIVLPLNATSINRESRFSSNFQPYVGMILGYDILKYLALGFKIGQGYVADAARNASDINSPTDYALSFMDGVLMGFIPVHPRVQMSGSLFVGLCVMTPPALQNSFRFGVDVGASLGVRYATLLNGLFMGVDFNTRMSLIPETKIGILPGIVSISLIPLIGYVF